MIVQCDFDETVTIGYVSTAIREAFASEMSGRLKKMEDDYILGKYSVEESNIRQFAHVKVHSKDEIEQFVTRNVVVRRGFKKFVKYCQRVGMELVIVSSGLDLYIKPTLRKLGFDHLQVYAGNAVITANGIDIKYTDPSGKVITQGFKESYLRHFKSQGKKILYIGDGLSDVVPAMEADFVVARSTLEKKFKESNLPYFRFETFEDVEAHSEKVRLKLLGGP